MTGERVHAAARTAARAAAAPSFLKTWLIAVRPFSYTASISAVALGAALAAGQGHALHGGLFALTLVGLVCFQAATNLANDAWDHRRGLDSRAHPMSGAVVRGLLSEGGALAGAAAFGCLGVACGLVLAWVAGWVVLLLGLIGAGLVVAYTGPRLCLKYAGLGDLAVFLAFGPLPVFGAWWVQTGVFSWAPVLWALPMVSFTVAILHANNWRDIAGDGALGCRTVANALGPRASARYYRMLVLGPFLLVPALFALSRGAAWLEPAPWTVLLALGGAPLAWKNARIDAARDAGAFRMLDGLTARLHLLFSVLLAAGFLLGRV